MSYKIEKRYIVTVGKWKYLFALDIAILIFILGFLIYLKAIYI